MPKSFCPRCSGFIRRLREAADDEVTENFGWLNRGCDLCALMTRELIHQNMEWVGDLQLTFRWPSLGIGGGGSFNRFNAMGHLFMTSDCQFHPSYSLWTEDRAYGFQASGKIMDFFPDGNWDILDASAVYPLCDLASRWLRECLDKHTECASKIEGGIWTSIERPPLLPTRVVDVGGAGQEPRLKIANPGEKAEYLALSYAWGDPSGIAKTTAGNIEDRTLGIALDTLPRTIRDAVVLTRLLEVRYLWVDSLCILQSERNSSTGEDGVEDDNDDTAHRQDWLHEAQKFGQYYENALITVAATGASDASEGLFLPRAASRHPAVPIELEAGGEKVTVHPPVPLSHTEFSLSPLYKRGWTHPERWLSRRILHMDRHNVSWECIRCRCSDFDPKGNLFRKRRMVDHLRLFRQLITKPDALAEGGGDGVGETSEVMSKWVRKAWLHLLEAYLRARFSFISDRLPALSGVARKLQELSGLSYYAGLWEGQLEIGLCWFSNTPPEQGQRDVEGNVPSWSWASGTCVVCYDLNKGSTAKDLKVLSVATPTCGPDVGGQLVGRSELVLRGLTADLDLATCMLGKELAREEDVEGSSWIKYRNKDKDKVGGFEISYTLYLDWMTSEELRLGTMRAMLMVSHAQHYDGGYGIDLMILRPIGERKHGVEVFERVAWLCMRDREEQRKWHDSATIQTLMLV